MSGQNSILISSSERLACSLFISSLLLSGNALDLNQSLHNQGVVEQEHVTLVHSPSPDSGTESPAKTEGVTTHSDSFTNSEVGCYRVGW